jgi:hypothetical protein
VEELIPVGPLRVRVGVPRRPPAARLLVGKITRTVDFAQGLATIEVPSVLDHEVIVIE